MKKLIAAVLLFLPLCAMAGNNNDPKYLTGAVPEVDGRVIWSQTFGVKNKSKQEIYNTMLSYVQSMMKEKAIKEPAPTSQTQMTKLLLDDSATGNIVARMEQWLVFKNKPLCLDRSRIYYQISIQCEDGKCHIDISNIRYLYEEERDGNGGQRLKAEEWITDKYALNKSKTKLTPQAGKFRRMTVDLKDDIFSNARKAFGEKISVKS